MGRQPPTLDRHPLPWTDTPHHPRQTPSRQTATAADGKRPTGKHSCLKRESKQLVLYVGPVLLCFDPWVTTTLVFPELSFFVTPKPFLIGGSQSYLCGTWTVFWLVVLEGGDELSGYILAQVQLPYSYGTYEKFSQSLHNTKMQIFPTLFRLFHSKVERPIKSANLKFIAFYQLTSNFTFTNMLRSK